jgi:hypothetical protein
MFNYIKSTAKVFYDKTVDYVYYTEQEENHQILDDSLNDYPGMIKIDLYEDQHRSMRVYPPSGVYNEYMMFWSEPTHVIDNIYLGSAYNAASYTTLKNLNIKIIINATKEISNYYENDNDFIYLRYQLYDNNKNRIIQYLEQSFEDIQKYKNEDGNILIHCFMGASRSASIVLYYLMKTQCNEDGTQYSFDDAIKYLREKRITVNPTFRLTKDLAGSFYKN